MSRMWAGAVAACVVVGSFAGAPVAGAVPGDPCGPDQATATDIAIAHTPHDDKTQAPWNPAAVGGSTFDSCANLSAVVVSIDNPRPNSPRQVFLFNRGTFVGTGTSKSRPYTTLDTAASTKDEVVVVFISGKTCLACDDGAAHIVRYRWNGVLPVMVDPIPPAQTWP